MENKIESVKNNIKNIVDFYNTMGNITKEQKIKEIRSLIPVLLAEAFAGDLYEELVVNQLKDKYIDKGNIDRADKN